MGVRERNHCGWGWDIPCPSISLILTIKYKQNQPPYLLHNHTYLLYHNGLCLLCIIHGGEACPAIMGMWLSH